MSKQKSCSRSLIITDADEQLDPEDLNPFSFREFLRWKNQDQDLEQDLDKVVQLQSAAEEEEDEGGQEVSLTFDPEVRSCFFLRPSLAPQEEDRWGRSLQSAVDSMSSFCTEEDEEDEEEETRFSSKHEDQQDQQDQQGAAAGGGENYEGDDETSIAEAVTSCRRRSSRSSQTQIQQMEENVSLRRSIRELQRRSDANELRVLELSEELVQRRCQEEKEAQDLESMVQSVEQNLHLMTKRALKAEGCVSKLKVELQQLQSENDSLKAADSEIVMTMRHNAQLASEYLNKTASHAHSSIRQLLGEAETLCLVSQLLQSIDKISIHDSES